MPWNHAAEAVPQSRAGLARLRPWPWLVVLAVSCLTALQVPLWQQAERGLDTQLQRWRGPRQPPQQLVLVEIDDATVQQGSWFAEQVDRPAWADGIGTLPWPRARYGDLIDRLLQAGAPAIAINVVFAGPSSKGRSDDQALAAVLRQWPGRLVLAAEMLEPQDIYAGSALTLVQPYHHQPSGLSNIVPPGPGQPARHPEHYGRRLLPAHGIKPWPSLGGQLLQQAGRSSRQPDADRWLNFYGPSGHFRHVSAWEVLDPGRWALLQKRVDWHRSLVLLGSVVGDGSGGFETPFGRLSGLELLATGVANSLDGSGLYPWPAAAWARGLLAALPALVVLVVASRRRGLAIRLLVTGSGLVLTVVVAVWTFQSAGVLLPVLGAALALLALSLVFGAEAYAGELAERRRLRRTFERYVAPDVVQAILADPRSADGLLQGKVLPVTVLFSDLKGFTQLTQRRTREGQIPLHLRQLNSYLGAMVEVISANGGTVDKFIGDCVMAVFGSPLSRGQQAEAIAAVRCAIAMAERLAQLNQSWARQGLEPLASGIGLATGEVAVGQIGSPQRLDFTVIGDTVNLAARLESLTRVVETPLLVDATTAALVASEIPMTSAGVHAIKGIGEREVFRR